MMFQEPLGLALRALLGYQFASHPLALERDISLSQEITAATSSLKLSQVIFSWDIQGIDEQAFPRHEWVSISSRDS